MSKSIRKFVGVGAAALALGGFFALIVAPLVAGAGVSNTTRAGVSVSGALFKAAALSKVTVAKAKVPAVTHTATTPTAACTTARQALDAAKAKDKAEDAAELAAGKTAADVEEDKAELAVFKPLIAAVVSACGLTKPTPSAACTAAMQTVKAAIAKERAEDIAEKTAGTEGSTADVAEDQAEKAAMISLWKSVSTACGFSTRFTSRTSQLTFSAPTRQRWVRR